jgi:hypothetical protein
MRISVIPIGVTQTEEKYLYPRGRKMKFNEFAASFRNAEETIASNGTPVQGPPTDVAIAGTILATKDAFCIIDINGAQYEISAADVSDITVVLPPIASKAVDEESGNNAAHKKGATAKVEKEKVEKAEIHTGPQFVLIKINRNAVLYRRLPIQATAVAALGTWVSIAPPATKPAASSPAKP